MEQKGEINSVTNQTIKDKYTSKKRSLKVKKHCRLLIQLRTGHINSCEVT
jgi:hypothetical protein